MASCWVVEQNIAVVVSVSVDVCWIMMRRSEAEMIYNAFVVAAVVFGATS